MGHASDAAMSLKSNLSWVSKRVLNEIRGKAVLDVGSRNWDMTITNYVKSLSPQFFCGVDLLAGFGVDAICGGQDLVSHFGREKFDVTICLEVMEHVKEWREVINNLKEVTKIGGLIVLTTRTRDYPVHGYPEDYWRYELEDIESIFEEFHIEDSFDDSNAKGVYVIARKLKSEINDLSNINLHSVIA